MIAPVPVAVGVNWTTAFVALLNLLVGGLLVAIVKSRPALKKIAADREANLLSERAQEMEEMRNRITRFEAALQEKEKAHSAEIERLASKQEAKERYYEALRRADIHRTNNLNTAFRSLLMLLKQGVAVEKAVTEVEEMRAKDMAREAEEVAMIRAAAIKAGLEPEA